MCAKKHSPAAAVPVQMLVGTQLKFAISHIKNCD